ncbi:hypothetical protein ACFOSC_23560 [Streptantibioticus rubrisoli]|uniref:Uncharacterized protein n=1 Tax=Streptantibioticus rubrisoli TaxID=1387313 RepID=A0ABT1PPN7_9ACTN|nr:hypothetical protein [Streptantibioticus rubrisoli]MCQ4046200.1 hypothetical protein [Streptantibioticus rubrisoli]
MGHRKPPESTSAASGRIPLAVVVQDDDGLISHWSSGARSCWDATVPELLRGPGLSVFARGRIELVMAEYRADGSRIDLPAQWLVVGR